MKPNSKSAATQAELARALKVSPAAVCHWLRRPDWPFPSKPPWNIADIRRWRATITSGREAGSGLRELRQEQSQLVRFRRALLENKYIERSIHDRAMVGLVGEFRRRVEDWIEALPPVFAHQPEVEIRSTMTAAYDDLCAALSAMVSIPLADADEVEQLKNTSKVRAAAARWSR